MITKDQIKQVHNELSKLQAMCDPLMSHQEELMRKILDGVLGTLKAALDAPEPASVDLDYSFSSIGYASESISDIPPKTPEPLSDHDIDQSINATIPDFHTTHHALRQLARAIEAAVLENLK